MQLKTLYALFGYQIQQSFCGVSYENFHMYCMQLPVCCVVQSSPMFRTQVSFLHSVLSLTRTHISLVAPLGPSCVRMACGHQVKPLRNLLFNFIDSQLPPSLDKVYALFSYITVYDPCLRLLCGIYVQIHCTFDSCVYMYVQ